MQDPIGCTGKKIMIEWEHLHPMRRAASAVGGKNEKAGAKTMGISHEYHSTSHRARHGGVSGKLRLAGVVLAILVLAYAITAILENGASAKDAQSEPVASGIAQDILAPLPMQGEAADSDSSGDSTAPDGSGDAQAVTLETFGPARQDAAAAVVKAYDVLSSRGIIASRRGMGYFVTPEARDLILQNRREVFYAATLPDLFRQMRALGLTPDDIKAEWASSQTDNHSQS